MHERALLIDAMGTLLALEDPVTALRTQLRGELGLELDEERVAGALRAEITHYRAHMLQGRDLAGVTALRRDCAAVLRDGLGIRVSLDVMTEQLLAGLRFRAHPDAAPALIRARARGARVIVVSNWDASLPDVLHRVGLAGLLDGVLTSAGVGAAKPAPAIFHRALALAGVPARACLHVGDSLAEDVAGARAAGIDAILLDRSGAAATAQGVAVIGTLADLP